jgi:hypothetical protein
MGLQKPDPAEAESAFSRLGSWHANLLYIDGRKCILFANDKTLFNFLVPAVSRARIRELERLFRSSLACVIADEKLSPEVVRSIDSEYEDLGFASTNNRSVLGSMNDLAFHYKCHAREEGGVHDCDLPAIIRRLNRMPMTGTTFTFPIEGLKALYRCAT